MDRPLSTAGSSTARIGAGSLAAAFLGLALDWAALAAAGALGLGGAGLACAGAAGSPWAFVTAVAGVAAWLALGPVYQFSDTWWLVAGTVCSVVPTLMVFLIQNMQNREAKAMQLKLDELIRATGEARNQLIQL